MESASPGTPAAKRSWLRRALGPTTVSIVVIAALLGALYPAVRQARIAAARSADK